MPAPEQIVEYIGYTASFIVFISFLMSSILKLRWINLIGSFIFAVYGFMIHSYPTGVLNLAIVGINIYYLVRMKKHEEIYSVLPTDLKSKYLHRFIMFYGHDIQKYFDEFSLESKDSNIAFFIHCDMTTAGVIIGKDNGDGSLTIHLDYTTPQYRDFRAGKYFYHNLHKKGYKKLIISSDNKRHLKYIKKMGFVQQSGDVYIKELSE